MIQEIVFACFVCFLKPADMSHDVEIKINIPDNDAFEVSIMPVQSASSGHFTFCEDEKTSLIRKSLPLGDYELKIRPADEAILPDYIILTRLQVTRAMPRLEVTIPANKMRVSFHETLFSRMAQDNIGILLERKYFSKELNAPVECMLSFGFGREDDSYVGNLYYLTEGVYAVYAIEESNVESYRNPKKRFDLEIQKQNGKMTYKILKEE